MKTKLNFTLIASFAILTIGGNAEEVVQNESTLDESQHVIVDSRPLPLKKRLQMQEARQCEEESADELIELGVLIIPIKTQSLFALASNDLNLTTASNSQCYIHSIESFPRENIVKMEDGSEWIIDKTESHILRHWEPGNAIAISPKQQYVLSSHYTYVMSNKDKGTSIDVNLFLGPIAFGPWSSWVVGIDQNLGKVYVLNGQGERSVWEVSNSDMYLFKDWKVNDTVILGDNDNWLWYFSSHNNMIINVNMNHYVRAKQVSSTPYKMVG